MLKNPKIRLLAIVGGVALLGGAGAGLVASQFWSAGEGLRLESVGSQPQAMTSQTQNLLGLSEAELQQLAETSKGRDRDRARYMLAAKGLDASPSQTLKWLEGLERSYRPMAPHILNLRAWAYQEQGQLEKADENWQELLNRYPQSPVAAEALYALGANDSQSWDEAIARFPSHPRSVEIAVERLKKTPRDVGLMMIVARHGYYRPEVKKILGRLLEGDHSQLKPEDWEAIAFTHWEQLNFEGAAKAYAKAPRSARSLYRTARSLQLSEQQTKSKPVYREVIQAFPKSEEAGLALKRLGEIEPGQKALPYLDRLIKEFPVHAPEALLRKAEILEGRAASDAASKARQTLLTQYTQSAAAAEVRWKLAEKYAQSDKIAEAMKLAQEIVKNNPESPYAPEAGFWIGRWYQKQGQSQQAAAAFQSVLRDFPHSYYAWRSAGILGLPVGDFFSVKDLQPEIIPHPGRVTLPAGSEVLQELYLMGQDLAAWRLWQVEHQNRVDPTVAQQYTDGMLRLGVGDNLDGIFMLASLAQRSDPEEKKQAEALRQTPAYWYGLYPWPFMTDIQAAAQAQKVNVLLVTGLIRQESRFMPGIESGVGAKGLMQVMPETAAYIAENINLKQYKLTEPKDNLKLGTWYMDYVHDEWDGNSMLAVASYNAGPGAVGDWVKRFQGLDVDTFVERIPFPETKGYVSSVFENYWNYMRLYNPEMMKLVAQHSPKHAELMQKP